MNEREGGPAFPTIESVDRFNEDSGKYEPVFVPQGGMTLRAYIASKNMAAMHSTGTWPSEGDLPELARRAVVAADALIGAL